MRNNYYIYHTPYLRNRISSDHNFWYTYVKWYLWVFFSFFQNFDFSGCYGDKRGLLGGKRASPKWEITITSVTHHISGTVHHLIQVFFSFFLNFDFSCTISQEQCSIWSWFLVHYCKMMISPGVFFQFF